MNPEHDFLCDFFNKKSWTRYQEAFLRDFLGEHMEDVPDEIVEKLDSTDHDPLKKVLDLLFNLIHAQP